MKTLIPLIVALAMALSTATSVVGADDLSAHLQRGLFEEEANRNLDAAIQAYQSVITQFDKNRQLAATAVFRLAECYRKLGKTNDAIAQYQRILRDFVDQSPLTQLSEQNLFALSTSPSSRARWFNVPEDQLNLLTQLKKLPKKQQALLIQQEKPTPVLASLINALLREEQKLAVLRQDHGESHPEVLAAETARSTIEKQIDEQVDATIATLEANVTPPALSRPARAEQRRLMEEEIQLVESEFKTLKSQFDVGVVSQDALTKKQRELLGLRRQLAALEDEATVGPAGDALLAATDEEQKEVQRIKTLIENSPDLINSPDATGQTPLHKAAAAGQLVVTRFLLANKADANARLTKKGTATPLMLAARNGHKTMVELLLANGADVNASGVNPEGKVGTALHFASANNYKSVAEVLLANKADVNAKKGLNGRTPLHEAAAAGSRSLVELLLANGADINAQDSEGTSLYYATTQGHEAVVDLLIARKADVNPMPANGTPPVAEAVRKRNLKIAEVLLANGADVNSKALSFSLLHLALGSPEMLKLIIAHKPDLEMQDERGLTPLQKAVYDGASLDSIQLLLAAGANPNLFISSTGRLPPLQYQRLGPGNTELVNVQGSTPLMIAVLKDRTDVVEALLKHGADPNNKFQDKTPLHRAIEKRSLPLVNAILAFRPSTELRDVEGYTPLLRAVLMKETKICEALIKAGADVNAPAPRYAGRSSLHIAVEMQSKDIVQLLLTNKAEVNVIDEHGRTPLSIAKERNPRNSAEWQTAQEELTQLLLKHGANEYLQRLNYIGIARGGQQPWPQLFSKGTNAYNRYTLFEAIALCYPSGNNQNPVRFPDLTRIEINRLEPKENKTKDIRVDVDTLLKSGECSQDVWLEWGDIVEIPERDHPINEQWSGLPGEICDALRKCLERSITIVVKGERITLKQVPNVWTSPRALPPGSVSLAELGGGKRAPLSTFRLRETIYAAGVLRASSDVTRVTVKRTDPITKEKLELLFNLDKVDPQTDLWLRDGDVIEIPEK